MRPSYAAILASLMLSVTLVACGTDISPDVGSFNSTSTKKLDLVILSDKKFQELGARCLDGSPAGLYYGGGSRDDVFVLSMAGGGLCFTPKDCQSRAKTSLGSSKKFGPHYQTGFVHDTPSIKGAPTVHIPYCSGDLHSGTRKSKHWYTFGVYFSGHNIIEAAVLWAMENTTIKKAKKILITGVSAGGISSILHADYFKDKFPWAKVKVAPISGWFISVTPYDFRPPIGISLEGAHLLYNGYTHHNCNQVNRGRCYLGESVHKTTTTPLLVVQNEFDQHQINDENGCPSVKSDKATSYVHDFGSAMKKSLKSAMSEGTFSLFLASCFQHGMGSKTAVKGVEYSKALDEWFAIDDDSHAPVRYIDDDCGLPCNPTCPHFPK